jgi:hypothetical protein
MRNGQFPDSPILGKGKYCGEVLPPKLTTTSNNAYLKYTGVHNVAVLIDLKEFELLLGFVLTEFRIAV